MNIRGGFLKPVQIEEVGQAKKKIGLVERDSMYFDADTPHGYRRLESKPSAAIVVTAP